MGRLAPAALIFLVTMAALALAGCLELSPAEVAFRDGTDLQRQGEFEEAIAKYDEAVRLEPNFVNAYINRGLAYLGLDQYRRGVEDFDEAIRVDPSSAPAYGNRAMAHALLGNDEAAQQDLDRAVDLGVDREFLEEALERLRERRQSTGG